MGPTEVNPSLLSLKTQQTQLQEWAAGQRAMQQEFTCTAELQDDR